MKQFFISAIGLVYIITNLHAQTCTPDPKYAAEKSGFWPGLSENLPVAYANEVSGYNAVVNLKTITDTTVNIFGQNAKVFISAYKIKDITGLPPGFSFKPNTSPWVNGGSDPNFTPVQGCFSITASQASIQQIMANNPNGIDFPIKIVGDVQVSSMSPPVITVPPFTWYSDFTGMPANIDGYVIRVRQSSQTTGINNPRLEILHLEGNYPNPFNKSTEIRFQSPIRQSVQFEIHNMIGERVCHKNLDAKKGDNSITISAESLKPGIYFYSISDGSQSITRRMVYSPGNGQ